MKTKRAKRRRYPNIGKIVGPISCVGWAVSENDNSMSWAEEHAYWRRNAELGLPTRKTQRSAT